MVDNYSEHYKVSDKRISSNDCIVVISGNKKYTIILLEDINPFKKYKIYMINLFHSIIIASYKSKLAENLKGKTYHDKITSKEIECLFGGEIIEIYSS